MLWPEFLVTHCPLWSRGRGGGRNAPRSIAPDWGRREAAANEIPCPRSGMWPGHRYQERTGGDVLPWPASLCAHLGPARRQDGCRQGKATTPAPGRPGLREPSVSPLRGRRAGHPANRDTRIPCVTKEAAAQALAFTLYAWGTADSATSRGCDGPAAGWWWPRARTRRWRSARVGPTPPAARRAATARAGGAAGPARRTGHR